MANIFIQELFRLKTLIKSIDIKLSTQSRNGVKQILALITEDNEIVLHYCYGELPPILKRIPWIGDSCKAIEAICFDATATWLLIVCLDSSLYIIPALHIVDKKQKIDCKWCLTDVTYFPIISQLSNICPTCCVWWQTLECNQNALVGFDNGTVLLVSLTDGRVLGACSIPEPVKSLHICQDNLREIVSLLVTSNTERQWRLILEHHSNGYTWPLENSHAQETIKSKFHTLKQMGVDKLTSLRHRLGSKKDSQSDTTSESSCSEAVALDPSLNDQLLNVNEAPTTQTVTFTSNQLNKFNQHSSELELMPHLFIPQMSKNKSFYSVIYNSNGLVTIHSTDTDAAPIYAYKLLPTTSSLIFTDNLIYTLHDTNIISIISCQLSESHMIFDAEFNDNALVAQFEVKNERILNIFKTIDMSMDMVLMKKNVYKNKFVNHKQKQESNFLRAAIDTCVIVTNKSVYKIVIRTSPVQRFIDYVIDEDNLDKAEKLAYVFSLNLSKLLEFCGDLMISNGSYHSGIILYKEAKVHLLKRVLKLAVSADCKTLLKFVHLCLSANRIEMNLTTRIHIGNVAVMAYIELVLRSSTNDQMRSNYCKDFMDFLIHESYFDPFLAVNMACQAGHWNIVNLLSKSKGLQAETVVAIGKILQNECTVKMLNLEFFYALSEPTLTQSLLILPESSQIIFDYIRENVDKLPIEILKRLIVQLDPSQPCVIPFTRGIWRNNGETTTTNDTNYDSFDWETPENSTVTIKDLVQTFLCVTCNLIGRSQKICFDLNLMDIIVPEPETNEKFNVINKLPDLKLLSCGYEHAAVIRNNRVYTMGITTAGRLGTGPMLTNTSGPRLVNTLHDLKVIPLSISCGRKHTLCATDCGVFAWGSNNYGQLGLGQHVQETPYPQLLTTISKLKIIDISAGQYHSLALTHSGQVYTWGWGIHGQLGHGDCNNQYYPRQLKFGLPVRQVAGGHAHSLILTCDGKIFGFGSNAFSQLENYSTYSKKYTTPIWIVLMPEIYVPVEKITASYFHNMAVTIEQKVFMWGASPEEVRLAQQKAANNKINTQLESWKSTVQMYESQSKKPIKQISTGYRHCIILDQGQIFWAKNKEEEISQPNIKDVYDSVIGRKFSHVACGLDYTMAIDNTGQVLAWGTPAMIETILDISLNVLRKKQDENLMILKNTKRAFKCLHNHPISNNLPIEISVLPSITFTFSQVTQKLVLSNKSKPYFLIAVENKEKVDTFLKEKYTLQQDFQHIYSTPDIDVGQKTLHYALQTFVDFYDVENIIEQSVNIGDYQTASKVSFLHEHYVDSLSFSIEAFKKYITTLDIDDFSSLFTCKDSYDVKEKDQDIELIVKSLKSELDIEKTSACSSPARILSSSSSLDSLKQFGEEGGQESPCDSDVHQNISNYVQSIKKTNIVQSPTVRMIKDIKQPLTEKIHLDIKNIHAKDILSKASYIVEFYISKVYLSENYILMQNILLKCIEFWLSHNLPVCVLEDILLKNLDKYFYPLSILLFCKNFDDEDIINKKDTGNISHVTSSGFLKEFSTKFCLHLCSMVLENTNKS